MTTLTLFGKYVAHFMVMAKDITKRIEEGMEYPGQIKVTVIRETRAIEYAK